MEVVDAAAAALLAAALPLGLRPDLMAREPAFDEAAIALGDLNVLHGVVSSHAAARSRSSIRPTDRSPDWPQSMVRMPAAAQRLAAGPKCVIREYQ